MTLQQTIKERRSYERRSYERRSERHSRFHEREVSAAHIFKRERKKSATHSISWWAQNERKKSAQDSDDIFFKDLAFIENKYSFS